MRSSSFGAAAPLRPRAGKILAGENKSGKVDLSASRWTVPGPATAESLDSGVTGGSASRFVPAIRLPLAARGFRLASAGRQRLRGARAWGMYNLQLQGKLHRVFHHRDRPYLAERDHHVYEGFVAAMGDGISGGASSFVAPSVVNAAYDVRPNKVEQWNLSAQKAIPLLRSAITVSYVGNRAIT